MKIFNWILNDFGCDYKNISEVSKNISYVISYFMFSYKVQQRIKCSIYYDRFLPFGTKMSQPFALLT